MHTAQRPCSPLLLFLAKPLTDFSARLEYDEPVELNHLAGSSPSTPYVQSPDGHASIKTLTRTERGED